MQTGFPIQVILRLLYAHLLCAKEDQSKILTGIKKMLIYLKYFVNKVVYQSSSCKEMVASTSEKLRVDEFSGNKLLQKYRNEYLQLWPVSSRCKSNKYKAHCSICDVDFSIFRVGEMTDHLKYC